MNGFGAWGAPLLSELLMIGSAVSLALGWRRIRQGRVEQHRGLMLTAATLGAAFFVSYVLRTLLVGDTTFGGPESLRLPYLAFLQAHTVLATLAGILGIVTLRRALRAEFDRHRRIAPWTAGMWLVAAATGLVVYLMLYVVYPPGPTTHILKAILGH
ncbi:MAG: DUF420 domain-containing protein [Bacillota bacterium]|nr:DUF420 domain-containing protein [Bacillota bacterium]